MLRAMGRAAMVLGGFAVVGVALVAISHDLTAARIEANERDALLRSLHAVVGPEEHDNDLFADVIRVQDRALLGSDSPLAVYRARKGGEPVAALITAVAPDGYSGPIRLIVGVYRDGTVAGVRVVAHRETPGLGDGVEERRSDWVRGFDGRSLTDPTPDRWTVKKEGGAFDQFTGATITPRAVVGGVRRALEFFQQNRRRIFEAPADQT